MTKEQLNEAEQWLKTHRPKVTRVSSHYGGGMITYLAREGRGNIPESHIKSPMMFAFTREKMDCMAEVFKRLGIKVADSNNH